MGLNAEAQKAALFEVFQNINASIGATSIQNKGYSVFAAGTVYAFTNTSAALDFGTTDPTLVLPEAGTYLILGGATLERTGATVTTQTANLKLRRTNNTAGDLTGSTLTLDLPASTTLTDTLGRFQVPPALYTTTNTTDIITLFGNVSANLGAGTIDASAASIHAVRLF